MNIIKKLKDVGMIYEKDSKYYSYCKLDEEVTMEINELSNYILVLK